MVIDASAAASWFLKSQSNIKTDRLFENPDRLEFVAPVYFDVELRNVLIAAERRGALTAQQTDSSLAWARSVIRIATGDVLYEAERAMGLAREMKLSLYDAIYLEKAVREQRPLASRDRRLLEAAISRGVDVVDLRP